MKKKNHTLKWFQNRRGKSIYRNPIKTAIGKECCSSCEDTKIKVLTLKECPEVDHAQYLFDCSQEEGIEYFDYAEAKNLKII